MKKISILLLTLLSLSFSADINKAKLGGYGELHLNYSKKVDSDETPAPKFDFHRFVLFAGYSFSDQWSFNSELELEHNFVKDGHGELELEQAYIEYSPIDAFYAQAGVLLPSAGLINENHEPAKFLTVERPSYSKYIIPTTWFGNGIAVGGLVKGMIDYKLIFLEGLDDRDFGSGGLRGGRQKGYKPYLETALINGRVDFTGLPGLRAGLSVSVNELLNDVNNDHVYNRATLFEVHARYKANNVFFTGEFGTVAYDSIAGRGGELENSQGFYANLGYNVASFWNAEKLELYPYFQYGIYDKSSKLDGKNSIVYGEDTSELTEIQWGLTLLPIKNIAIKTNFGIEKKADSDDDKTFIFNAGVGYDF